jgi:hypothetical protein
MADRIRAGRFEQEEREDPEVELALLLEQRKPNAERAA